MGLEEGPMGINDLQWYPCLHVHLEDFGAKSLVVVTNLLEALVCRN